MTKHHNAEDSIFSNTAETTLNLIQTQVFNNVTLGIWKVVKSNCLLCPPRWNKLAAAGQNFVLEGRVLESVNKTEVWLKMDKSQQLMGTSTADGNINSQFAVSFFTAVFRKGLPTRAVHTAVGLPISNKGCPYSCRAPNIQQGLSIQL
jgi:hypothetical protein